MRGKRKKYQNLKVEGAFDFERLEGNPCFEIFEALQNSVCCFI
jgi:hypothetical protein